MSALVKYYIMCIVVGALHLHQVAGSCEEFCHKMLTNPLSIFPRTDCNCLQNYNKDKYSLQRYKRVLDESPILYEPADTRLFQKHIHFKTPYFIHNPTTNKEFKKGINIKNKTLMIIDNIDSENVSAPINELNKIGNLLLKSTDVISHEFKLNNIEKNIKHNLLKEIYEKSPIYIDLDVTKTENTSVTYYLKKMESYDFTEKIIEECIDLHIIVFLRQCNNKDELNEMCKIKNIKQYTQYTDVELKEAIDKKCSELSNIVERSLQEIKQSWPIKHGDTLITPLFNSTVTDTVPLQITTPRLHKQEEFKEILIIEDNSKESLKESTHTNVVNDSKNYSSSTQTKYLPYLKVEPMLVDLENDTSNDETILDKEKATIKLGDASAQESSRQNIVTTVDSIVNTTEVVTPHEPTTSSYYSSFTKDDSTNIISYSKSYTEILGNPNYSVNDTSKIKNRSLLTPINSDYIVGNTKPFRTTSYNHDSLPTPALTSEHLFLTTTLSVLSNINDLDRNHDENSSYHPSYDTVPVANSSLRNEYNQSEIQIQRIVTKELSNNTVTSYTYGYEPLSNVTNDVTETDSTATENNGIETNKDTSPTEVPINYEEKSRILNQEITGKLLFVFNDYYVPAKFIQGPDGELRVGMDGPSLCDKLTKDEPSILISTLCNCKSSEHN